MPYANNQGVRIYYEVEGVGQPLVLMHGAAGSSVDWHDRGYVKALKEDYRLILLDARGRGKSDKPDETEAYLYKVMASDVAAVLDNMGLKKVHYFGYAMGGAIGLELALNFADRFHSLILGGASPIMTAGGEKYLRQLQQMMELGTAKGMEAVLAVQEQQMGTAYPPEVRARRLAFDPRPVASTFKANENRNHEADLQRIAVPCLLLGGELDPLFASGPEAVKRIPGATLFSMPGLGHVEAIAGADLVVPRVKEFLAGVSTVYNA